MARSIPKSAPKFEVDESRLEQVHNDPRVVRYERSEHVAEWSSASGIRVMPDIDIFELMGRDPEDDADDDNESARR